MFSALAQSLRDSPAHDAAVHLLSNVPGLPPIVQTVHILAVAAIMGSVVMIDLRVLGLALRGQSIAELIGRLMPWTWWALPVLLLSGLMFVLARPGRYFVNPVFGCKAALLMSAIGVSWALQTLGRRHAGSRAAMKALAALSLALWVGVVLAGRWIAYADYLFPPE